MAMQDPLFSTPQNTPCSPLHIMPRRLVSAHSSLRRMHRDTELQSKRATDNLKLSHSGNLQDQACCNCIRRVLSSPKLKTQNVQPAVGVSSSNKEGTLHSRLKATLSSPCFGPTRYHSTSSLTSDGSMSRRHSNGCTSIPAARRRGNAVMQIAQRSNGADVKAVISDLFTVLRERRQAVSCEQNSEASADFASSALCEKVDDDAEFSSHTIEVLDALAMLAQWACADVYYKILITKYKGIDAVVEAMESFSEIPYIQMYGCQVLANLSNKMLISQCGGVPAAVTALEKHGSTMLAVRSDIWVLIQLQLPLLAQELPETLSRLGNLLNSQNKEPKSLSNAGKEAVKMLTQWHTVHCNGQK